MSGFTEAAANLSERALFQFGFGRLCRPRDIYDRAINAVIGFSIGFGTVAASINTYVPGIEPLPVTMEALIAGVGIAKGALSFNTSFWNGKLEYEPLAALKAVRFMNRTAYLFTAVGIALTASAHALFPASLPTPEDQIKALICPVVLKGAPFAALPNLDLPRGTDLSLTLDRADAPTPVTHRENGVMKKMVIEVPVLLTVSGTPYDTLTGQPQREQRATTHLRLGCEVSPAIPL